MSGTATAGKPPKNWEGETLRTWPRTRQAVFGTMIMAEINRFRGDTLAPGESKFENPEIGSFRETAVRAHFGRKLQKIFPLPSDELEPEDVRMLLQKIREAFATPRIPGNG